MGEVIVVEDVVTRDCRRVVHLMSNREFEKMALVNTLLKYGGKFALENGKADVDLNAGAWHLRAEWPYKGALNIEAEGWPQAKTMVAWSFDGCINVTEALMHASIFYEQTFGCKPQYGFLRSLPRGVENGRETGPLLVFEAEWMMEKCVAVA